MPELNKAIPELEYMARYDAVTQDLKDLGEEPYKFDKELPHETGNKAIGWLYCAEGSNLGAAFLFKHAQNSNTPANSAHATWPRIQTAEANTGAHLSSI